MEYDYCLYTKDGQHIPLVLPLAAGGVTNKCSECGLTIRHAGVPEMDAF